jgi:TetR/AcrR family transcriptional repressor of bet genes
MIQERIVDAAIDVLIKKGLNRWTIDAVAREAGCAKGLVHYHHRTKAKLLAEVAARLSRRRFHQRRAALEHPGAQGLDGLWVVLGDGVASGTTAAWASLLGYPLAQQATGLAPSEEELRALADTIEESMALPPMATTQALALLATLDGFEMALLSKAEPDAVHDAYHRFWLTLISG